MSRLRRVLPLLFAASPLVTLPGSPGSARAEECIFYADYIHTEGSIVLESNASDIAAIPGQNRAVILHKGMISGPAYSVADYSNPAAPSLIGYATLPEEGRDVAVVGPMTCIAAGTTGLIVLGYGEVTILDTPGEATGVGKRLNRVYVGDGSAGLRVVNVFDPHNPVLMGVVDTPGSAGELAVSGDWVFLADGPAGLQVVNVLDPAAPVLAATLPIPGGAWDVALVGSLLHVASEWAGLTVVDVSNPSSPAILATLALPSAARAVAARGKEVYLGCGGGGLAVVDVTDPAAPALRGNGVTDGVVNDVGLAEDSDFVTAVEAHGRSGRLRLVDIANPAAPSPLSALGQAVADAAVQDGLAYLAAGPGGGLRIYDFSDPLAPQLVGAYTGSVGDARGVDVSGTTACIVDESALWVIDVSDPGVPGLAGSVGLAQPASGVCLAGQHAYVACGYLGGLQIVDLSDPGAPFLAGSTRTTDAAVDVVVEGGYAYVADTFGGLSVVDVSDPGAPALLGSAPASGAGFANGVALAYPHAFVSWSPFEGNTGGIDVVEVINPSSPIVVDHLWYTGGCYGVARAGDVIYAAGVNNLHVLQWTGPAHPTDPGSLLTLGTAPLAGFPGGLAFAPEFLLVAEGGEFEVFPSQCGSLTSAVAPPGPRPGGRGDGLTLVAGPVPASGEILLRFSLARAGGAELAIFDAAGRRVRDLARSFGSAGPHEARWDGRDGSGRPVASGVYWARLTSGESVRSERLLIAR